MIGESDSRYSDTNCPLHGTPYCAALNMKSCGACTVRAMNAEQVKTDLDAIEALLPEGGVYALRESQECLLCRRQIKRKAAGYALLDLAHAEPKRDGNYLGLRSKARQGTVLPVQVRCCNACRARYQEISDKHTIYTVAAAALMLVLMSFRQIREPLMAVFPALPLLISAVVIGGVWLWGKNRRRSLLRLFEKETYMHVMEAPALQPFAEKGWFELNSSKKGISHLVFSREPLDKGLYTGENPAASGED